MPRRSLTKSASSQDPLVVDYLAADAASSQPRGTCLGPFFVANHETAPAGYCQNHDCFYRGLQRDLDLICRFQYSSVWVHSLLHGCLRAFSSQSRRLHSPSSKIPNYSHHACKRNSNGAFTMDLLGRWYYCHEEFATSSTTCAPPTQAYLTRTSK